MLRELLAAHGVRPSRALGQNFLVDGNTRARILEAAALEPSDAVLEIGPGAGVLTEGLLALAGRVVAVEKDARLCALLRERFEGEDRLELVEGDALEVDLDARFAAGIAKVVSNLPYSSGTRIVQQIALGPHRPALLVVTLQSDVAARMTAAPGARDYGLLAIGVQRFYDVGIVRRIPPTCFHPAPEVQSSLLRLERRARPRAEPADPALFHALTHWCFAHRRKQLQALLARRPPGLAPRAPPPAEALRRAGLEPGARPETLAVEDWARLSDALGGRGP